MICTQVAGGRWLARWTCRGQKWAATAGTRHGARRALVRALATVTGQEANYANR